jgi:DNA primase
MVLQVNNTRDLFREKEGVKMRGNARGNGTATRYSESHIRGLLRSIGLPLEGETAHDFLVLCPFHNNRNTPSLSISKTKDGFICFNADCAETGTIVDLVARVSHRNYFEALRFVLMAEPTEQEDFELDLATVLDDTPEYTEFSQDTLDKLFREMCVPGNAGREYLQGRGFTDETIDYFKVGYSTKKNMVAVPMHSPTGIPVGVVGRIAGADKVFKNSVGLPTSRAFFNLHRAKRASPTAILTESCFDSMAVHQAGFPNSIGNLGGHLGPVKYALLDKFFDRIIIFTDNREIDVAGLAIGMKIQEQLGKRKDILWARAEAGEGAYPSGLKDASSILETLGEDAVRDCILNAIPHYELMSMV